MIAAYSSWKYLNFLDIIYYLYYHLKLFFLIVMKIIWDLKKKKK